MDVGLYIVFCVRRGKIGEIGISLGFDVTCSTSNHYCTIQIQYSI